MIQPVQTHDRKPNTLYSLTQGAVIGTGAGYIAKYVLPLTKEELTSDEYVKVKDRVNSEKLEVNFRVRKFLDKLATKENKSYAEEQYLKLFEGLKEGDKVSRENFVKIANDIRKNKPEALPEFRAMCNKSREIADSTAKLFMKAYNLVVKHQRPTGFFLATGAIIGGFAGLTGKILKTEVRTLDGQS